MDYPHVDDPIQACRCCEATVKKKKKKKEKEKRILKQNQKRRRKVEHQNKYLFNMSYLMIIKIYLILLFIIKFL